MSEVRIGGIFIARSCFGVGGGGGAGKGWTGGGGGGGKGTGVDFCSVWVGASFLDCGGGRGGKEIKDVLFGIESDENFAKASRYS